jgi:hypothetical protein
MDPTIDASCYLIQNNHQITLLFTKVSISVQLSEPIP